MYSPLALGPRLYQMEWPHIGIYKVENQHVLVIKSQTNGV